MGACTSRGAVPDIPDDDTLAHHCLDFLDKGTTLARRLMAVLHGSDVRDDGSMLAVARLFISLYDGDGDGYLTIEEVGIALREFQTALLSFAELQAQPAKHQQQAVEGAETNEPFAVATAQLATNVLETGVSQVELEYATREMIAALWEASASEAAECMRAALMALPDDAIPDTLPPSGRRATAIDAPAVAVWLHRMWGFEAEEMAEAQVAAEASAGIASPHQVVATAC